VAYLGVGFSSALLQMAMRPTLLVYSNCQQGHWHINKMKNLLIVLFAISILASCNNKPESNFTEYETKLKSKRESLHPDAKQDLEKRLKEIKQSHVYKELITDKTLSPEYLPLLTAIGQALATSGTEGFSFSETYANELDTLQYNFALQCGAICCRDGLPIELCDVMDRYAKAYKYFGEQGSVFVDASGKSYTHTLGYDLATPMAIIKHSNKEALQAVAAVHKAGIVQWGELQKGMYYPYMISKPEFIAHLKAVYPESTYIPKHEYSLTASELYDDYKANEVTADRQYKGKVIAVTGIVSSIGKDIFDNPYILLSTGEYFEGVQCYPENEDIAASAVKGNKITLIGRCAGISLTNVLIKECTVEEL
jgi:hypothetical protein